MKVDYHVHLEEGPYSFSYIEKIMNAIEHFKPIPYRKHSKEWFTEVVDVLHKRMHETEYSEWWFDFYLERAVQCNLKEVGIVDHFYRFKETRDYFERFMDLESPSIGEMQRNWLNNVMVRRLDEFVDFIEGQKRKWASHGVKLKLGMEADYFVGGEAQLAEILQPYSFDYIIGSVHYYNGWGFDNPLLQKTFEKYDLLKLYKEHFKTVEKAAASKMFDIIAHLDNMKVFNYRPEEALLQDTYRHLAKVLKESDVATEINPGLYYRYPVKEMCPSALLLDILVEEQVPFTTSSDSHFPQDIGIYGEDIQAMLMNRGVTKVATFTNRKREMVRFQA